MSTESQIKANRLNAQKSTGPKTAEGKAAVAQNAVKHGLFAHENVIKCEKQADFDLFCEELLNGLAPVGGVEAMLAERIVSLSWRLKRAERMSNEVLDVKIVQATAGSWDQNRRREAGLVEDSGDGQPELILGWATIRDFADAQVLERLLLYEKRIESSLYKAMNELQILQNMRKKEEVDTLTIQPSLSFGNKAAPARGRDARDTQGRNALATVNQAEEQTDQQKKQSQLSTIGWKSEKEYPNTINCEKQSQYVPSQRVKSPMDDTIRPKS